LITFLPFLQSGVLKAENTVVYGKAAGYGSKEITFYTISDPILHHKRELGSTTIAPDGTFNLLIRINQSIEIYSDLEKYCGTMVVEPGKNYRIELPPYSPKNSAEAHSIYFKPTPYWFGLPETDNNDLNFAVRSFLSDFNLETVKNTTQIYQQRSKETIKNIINGLENKYSAIKHPYFMKLRMYTYAGLENMIYAPNSDSVIGKYFAHQPIELFHPAYQQAFENVFTDFLRKQSLVIKNKKIVEFTDAGNYTALVGFFEHKGFSRELAELVVLKGLHDGYYTGSFSKDGVCRAIEMALTTTTSTLLQPIVPLIKRKLTYLAIGAKAPNFNLPNLKKERISLDQFNGKFVYLTFFRSKSADCRAELDSIISIEKRVHQVLTIVSVSLDDDFNNASELWKSKGYTWELLNGSKQKQIIADYNATLTPAFYLINPEGKLQLSQAPSPSHGFEPTFLRILRDYHLKNKPYLSKPGNFH